MDNFAHLPATVQVVLVVLLAVWLGLLMLVPFMIESIRNSSPRSRTELELLNQKMDRLIELLERSEPPARAVRTRRHRAAGAPLRRPRAAEVARAQGADDIGIARLPARSLRAEARDCVGTAGRF